MRLIELEVDNWRGLTGKLGPFSDTLNLISGPNEAGKSRFFQAIRYALFESYKGTAQHKQSLQSWTSPESPTVRLSFEVDGVTYQLSKRYLKGGYAELSGGGKTLKDANAEERSLSLIGGREATSRGGKSDDAMGIWPLLLVEQGRSRDAASNSLNSDTHSRLQDLLSGEIGTAAISASGKKLLELAAAERDHYFTPSGQEKIQLKNARSRREKAQLDLIVAEKNYAQQVTTAAELADTRRQLTDLIPRLNQARDEAKAAEKKAEAARDARSERDNKKSARDLAANRKENADNALEARTMLDREIQEAERVLSGARQKFDELSEREHQLIGELKQKEKAAQLTLEQRDTARDRYKVAQKSAEARQIQGRINTLQATLKTLEDNEIQIRQRREQRAKLVEITEGDLASLRTHEQDYKVARAQLDGAAMRFSITAQRHIQVNRETLDKGALREILITGREHITLEGIADIEVRPQQGTFDELKANVERAEDAWRGALESLGVADVAAAAQAVQEWSRVSREIQNLEREAGLISEEPLAALKEDLERLRTKAAELGDADNNIDLQAATDAHDRAQQALEDAQNQCNAADKLVSQTRTELAIAEATANQQANHQKTRQSRLDAMPTSTELVSARDATHQALGQAQIALDDAVRRFDALGGEQVDDDAKRLQRAAAKLEQRQLEAKSKLDELQGSLRMLVQAGSYEDVQGCNAELELATADLVRIERDACAAKRLYDVLAKNQKALVDRLTAPVVKRIQPYLADIFPGSSLQHGDKLDFTGLQSSNTEEQFEALSGGAQEQFSLVTRIGLAEVLAGEDRLPLILDDSLVNSDADRIKHVHRVLDRASEKLQIIVFTCHEVLFDALGADFHYRLPPTRQSS